jgi:phytoene desaturase
VLFGERYEELLRDIFDGPNLPDDFSLYLHAPTVTDRSLAPQGCSTFYVLSPVPHLGKAPTLTQSAWFRPHNRDDEIPGLYLVGAGTHPGAGIPGVVSSAKATASLVLRDLRREDAA